MKFQFKNYFINKIEFEENETFESEESIDVTSTFEVEIAINPEGDDARITLGAIIFDDHINMGYPFRLYIKMRGYFSFSEFENREEVFKFCKLNGLATLYPYLRSAVSSVITTSNHSNLVLPLMNIVNMTKDLRFDEIPNEQFPE